MNVRQDIDSGLAGTIEEIEELLRHPDTDDALHVARQSRELIAECLAGLDLADGIDGLSRGERKARGLMSRSSGILATHAHGDWDSFDVHARQPVLADIARFLGR